MSARAVTSEIASVNDDANAPRTAVSSFSADQALSDGRRCGRIRSCVADDQVDLGAAERLDAAGRVDRVGDELDAVAAIDAELSIGSGQRLDHPDIDCGALRKARADDERRQRSVRPFRQPSLVGESKRWRCHCLAPRHIPLPYVITKPQYRIVMRETETSRTHSIISSAMASSVGGIVRPSALAVFWLIANSNLVGA